MARFGAVAIFVMFAIINPVVSDLCLKGASMSLSRNFNPKASDFTEKTQCSSGEKCMRSKLVLDGGTMIMQTCVHGSKMSRLGMTVRTNLTGQIVKVGMNATAGFQRVLVQTESERRWMDRRTGSIQIENVKLTLREQKMGNLGHGMALTINTGRWEVRVWSKRYPNPAANPGKALLNIAIGAQYDADHDEVAPHGLVGQSYDGDNVAVDGAMDDYTGKEMTTKAMAEGAIEGTADQYRMADVFATEFMYSRFDALHAKPRDLTKLTGRKRAAKVAGGGPNFYQINALPDVE